MYIMLIKSKLSKRKLSIQFPTIYMYYSTIIFFGRIVSIYRWCMDKKQVCNLWLDGASQEHLSKKLGISAGTVNNIIQDLIGNDKQLVLMREISISAKNNIDIPQIAVIFDMNMIKRLRLEKDKLEMCFSALGIQSYLRTK